LSSAEFEFLGNNVPHNHLGKALLLKFFQYEYRFPEGIAEIHATIIEYVAQQLDVPATAIEQYNWAGRSLKQHRKEIREQLGFRPATLDDQKDLRLWLIHDVLPHEYRPDHLAQLVYQRLRREHIEPPTRNRIMRLVLAAVNRHEKAFFAQTYGRLSPEVRINLHQLIYPDASAGDDGGDVDTDEHDDNPTHRYPIHDLKAGSGAPNISNIKKIATRLSLLQGINLPDNLFADIPLPFLQQYQRQIAIESISYLQRRDKNGPQKAQLYTMLAAFCATTENHRLSGRFVHSNSQ
jgi:hypothetical protein